jgi:hypothetical protein
MLVMLIPRRSSRPRELAFRSQRMPRSFGIMGENAIAACGGATGRAVLEVAAARVLVELVGLGAQDLQHALVDAVLGEQTVDIDAAHLAHSAD